MILRGIVIFLSFNVVVVLDHLVKDGRDEMSELPKQSELP